MADDASPADPADPGDLADPAGPADPRDPGVRRDPGDEVVEALRARGGWEAFAGDRAARERLIHLLLERGATPDEVVEHAPDLGDLAIDLGIRPREGRWTSLRAAGEEAGLDLDEARRVWRALGFTETDEHAATLNVEEAALFSLFADVASGLGSEATLQLLRAMGRGLARLAQAERDALRIELEVPRISEGQTYDEVIAEYWRMGDEVLPRIEAAMRAVHRRHIVLSAQQAWATDAEGSAATTELAVGFADLVGFTERSDRLSTRELARAVSAFDALAHDAVHEAGAQVVKLIGDEVMFVADDPLDAARAALALTHHRDEGSHLPPMRAGLAVGRVISRAGDYFGPTVNLASRLAGRAGPGAVLVSAAAVDALGPGAAVEAMAPLELKGFTAPQPAAALITVG